jgi:hypothetical protein
MARAARAARACRCGRWPNGSPWRIRPLVGRQLKQAARRWRPAGAADVRVGDDLVQGSRY